MSRQIGAAKRQQYAADTLEHAADLVRSKTLSLRQAAKQYGIPKTTLQNTVHQKYDDHKVGHKTILTDQEEQKLAEWAKHMAKIGYGRTRQELAATVKKIMDDDGRKTPFRDNKPGRAWLDGFFRRHPQLSIRTSIQLGKERAIISARKVEEWFDDFKKYIETELGDKDILNDPTRIYNADETGVSLCLKGSQVIGFKGSPVMYHFGNSDKSQITVMAACSAAAHYLPPMIIFPGKRFGFDPLEGFEEAALGRSESGWMDSGVFCQWLENVFIPGVEARHVKKPVLLLIDGHSTHVTMKASDICLQNGIELYCLLEHASHLMQPLDLRLFSALKRNWRQAVRDWQCEHVGEYVTKHTFAQVFKTAWSASTTTDIAVKGFQEAGIFPLDSSTITSSIKIEPSTLFNVNKSPFVQDFQKKGGTITVETPSTVPHVPAETASATGESQNNDTNVSHSTDKIHSPQTIENKENQEPAIPNSSTPPSPFSKHLHVPTPKLPKSKSTTRMVLPKAITGSAYRKLLQEKKAQKEEEEIAKQMRKEERERKRKLREEDKNRKRSEREANRSKLAEEKRRKREHRERMLRAIEDSDSDHEVHVESSKCYTCEVAYSDDYIECTKCFRRFHLVCVTDQYAIDGLDLEFECKYC